MSLFCKVVQFYQRITLMSWLRNRTGSENRTLDPLLQPDESLSSDERRELIKKMNALPAQQFNELVFSLNPPYGLIPPMSAAQGDRTYALLSWAEGTGGCGLLAVQQIVEEFDSSQPPPI